MARSFVAYKIPRGKPDGLPIGLGIPQGSLELGRSQDLLYVMKDLKVYFRP